MEIKLWVSLKLQSNERLICEKCKKEITDFQKAWCYVELATDEITSIKCDNCKKGGTR